MREAGEIAAAIAIVIMSSLLYAIVISMYMLMKAWRAINKHSHENANKS